MCLRTKECANRIHDKGWRERSYRRSGHRRRRGCRACEPTESATAARPGPHSLVPGWSELRGNVEKGAVRVDKRVVRGRLAIPKVHEAMRHGYPFENLIWRFSQVAADDEDPFRAVRVRDIQNDQACLSLIVVGYVVHQDRH